MVQRRQSKASGFIWDTQGHVVTNYHVARGAIAIRVTFYDLTVCCVTNVVGADETKDIAVLKLNLTASDAALLQPVELGHSSSLAIGQRVFAIGNPFGLTHTLTSVCTSL
jgi:S1-C subfamily serine protease